MEEIKTYIPAEDRYQKMSYNYCGNSGLLLPKLSLGMWHNYGTYDNMEVAEQMSKYAFDNGITYFDLANNYGPEVGSAETNFGKIFNDNFKPYRDEMLIATKAGHEMWSGPYGGNSTRKNLMASIDQSLKRTGLEYFDIFYSHRYDGTTPIEQTAQALIDIVKSGKALYAGISKYPAELAEKFYQMMQQAGVPVLASQYRYSMFEREVESTMIPMSAENGSGLVAFSPLAQGLLTDKYIHGIPEDSRAARPTGFLKREQVSEDKIAKVNKLNDIALERGETLAQMALKWALRDKRVTSLIIGASSVNQIEDNLKALQGSSISSEELAMIDKILGA